MTFVVLFHFVFMADFEWSYDLKHVCESASGIVDNCPLDTSAYMIQPNKLRPFLASI